MSSAAPAPTAPAPDARSFRDALGRFATGVAFITAAPDGEPAGLIVNSLTSVSLEPPLVSFCPSRSSLTWSRMRRARRFCVNVLAEGQEPSQELARQIQSHVRDRLSAYAYPRLIEFVPDLPKTLTGKIRRIELRQREQEGVTRSE